MNIFSFHSAFQVFISLFILSICIIAYEETQNCPPPPVPKNILAIKSPLSLVRDPFPNYMKEIPLRIQGKSSEFSVHPIILQAANRHKVDPALIKAIIQAESGYNPRAVSKKGARGLMQLMPRTAEALGVEDAFNPEENIRAGVRYFKKLLDQFDGDVEFALAAYNAGSRRVREHQGIPPFGATRYYVKKVFRYYEYYKKEMTKEMDNT